MRFSDDKIYLKYRDSTRKASSSENSSLVKASINTAIALNFSTVYKIRDVETWNNGSCLGSFVLFYRYLLHIAQRTWYTSWEFSSLKVIYISGKYSKRTPVCFVYVLYLQGKHIYVRMSDLRRRLENGNKVL